MKKANLLIIIIFSLLSGLILGTVFAKHNQAAYVKRHFLASNTPTIFVHGWSSDGLAELPWIESAEQIHVARRVMVIHVRQNGSLKIQGQLTGQMNNPIIQVIFDDNRAGQVQDAYWLKTVMSTLRNRYQVTTYNAVGHSMGAYAWVYYNMLVGDNIHYPRLNKAVLVAGPYDGIIDNHKNNQPLDLPLSRLWNDYPNENTLTADGRPFIIHPQYRLLLQKVHRFPSSARVLNLYGNLDDGSNSDGVVSTVSAKSLGYLLKDRIRQYVQIQLTGSDAQHSQLHDNNLAVDKDLIDWLWRK